MDGEIWLDVYDLAVMVGITPRAIQKRLSAFISRAVPGKGRGGTRYQLLLSSLPDSWQAACRQRVDALPLPWQDAVLAKTQPAPDPEPPHALLVTDLLPVPVSSFPGAGSIAPVPPLPGAVALSSSCGGEDSIVPVPSLPGAVALSSPPADDTTYIKEWQRTCLHARLALLQELDRLQGAHGRIKSASRALIQAARDGQLPPELAALIPKALARGGQDLSLATLTRWRLARERGLSHLAPRARDAGPTVPPWGPALLKAWQRPQKPSLPAAIDQLAAPGGLPASVPVPSPTTARRFLQKLGPAERHAGRLGPRALQALRPYRQRDASGLWPGEIYSMDGHTFDAEVAHPFHGQPFRPEITSAVDIATRKLVGWSVALAESGLAVLDALRHACQTHGIPAMLYVDNGSGYRNALMEDQAIGFMARLGVTKFHSLPDRSQSRGVIERLHRTVWVRLAKALPTYMGDAMDQEARQKVHKLTRAEVKATGSRRLLPAFADFLRACEAAAAAYNAHPHASLPVVIDPTTGRRRHQSPDEVWAELVQQNPDALVWPDETDLADLFRPYKTAKVARGLVRLFGNTYYSADLSDYHGDSVFVGYDLHDAQRVWVRDRNQCLLAVATLDGNKMDYVPQTAIDHAHATRAKARARRLERHLEEVHLELTGSRPVIEGRLATPEEKAAAQEALAALAAPPTPPPVPDDVRPRNFYSDLELYQWVQDHPTLANDQDHAYLAECLQDEDFRDLIEREAQKRLRLKDKAA